MSEKQMEESTEVDNSAATSLKTCQKSLSTEGAAVENEKNLLSQKGGLLVFLWRWHWARVAIQRKMEE